MIRSGQRICLRHSRAFSSRWKQQRDSDLYANKAIKEGMRCRAAYKLSEINDRFERFLRQEMEPIPGAIFVQGDMNEDLTYQKILVGLAGKEADVVLSDMAPDTTGEKETDHVRIMQLADEALTVAQRVLRNGGTFCCKIFSGAEERDFRKDLESSFVKVSAFKPAASRKVSKEIYYVAQGFVPAHMVLGDNCSGEELYEDVKTKSGSLHSA